MYVGTRYIITLAFVPVAPQRPGPAVTGLTTLSVISFQIYVRMYIHTIYIYFYACHELPLLDYINDIGSDNFIISGAFDDLNKLNAINLRK